MNVNRKDSLCSVHRAHTHLDLDFLVLGSLSVEHCRFWVCLDVTLAPLKLSNICTSQFPPLQDVGDVTETLMRCSRGSKLLDVCPVHTKPLKLTNF